jgi:hypothetical protein
MFIRGAAEYTGDDDVSTLGLSDLKGVDGRETIPGRY